MSFALDVLPADARIVDVSSAVTLLPTALARAFPQGTIYITDIDSSWLEYVSEEAQYDGVSNIETIETDPMELSGAFLNNCVDLIILIKASCVVSVPTFLNSVRKCIHSHGIVLIVASDAAEAIELYELARMCGYTKANRTLSEEKDFDTSVVLLTPAVN